MIRRRKPASRLRYFVSWRLESGKEDWQGFVWRDQALRFWENLSHDTVESMVQRMMQSIKDQNKPSGRQMESAQAGLHAGRPRQIR